MERVLYADVSKRGMVEVVLVGHLYTYRHVVPTGALYEWSTSSPAALRQKALEELGEVPAGLSAALRMADVFEGWGRL